MVFIGFCDGIELIMMYEIIVRENIDTVTRMKEGRSIVKVRFIVQLELPAARNKRGAVISPGVGFSLTMIPSQNIIVRPILLAENYSLLFSDPCVAVNGSET